MAAIQVGAVKLSDSLPFSDRLISQTTLSLMLEVIAPYLHTRILKHPDTEEISFWE